MIKKPHALVILNGDPPSPELINRLWNASSKVICADGAANTLQAYGKTPDIIIGDLDSVSPQQIAHFKTVAVLKVPDQNMTDGEKALTYCLTNHLTTIQLLGAFGGRLDHSLYNLELLKRFHQKGLCITCYTGREKVFLVDRTTLIKEKPGTRISLSPVFGDVSGVTLRGFEYNLERAVFQFGAMSSISNRIKAPEAKIELNKGQLLVIIECIVDDEGLDSLGG